MAAGEERHSAGEDREEEEEEEGEDVLAEKQRLKAALHHSVGRVCGEVEGTQYTREFIAAVSEATFNQLQLLAGDIEAFAKHAKRTVVAPEDVRLCCRRNDDLLTHVTEMIEKLKKEKETRKAPVANSNKEGEGEGGRNTKTSKKRKITIENDDDD